MKKTVSAILAVATLAGSLVTAIPAANAQGRGVAAGIAGGLIGGAIIGGAIANSQRPAYGYYEPAPAYVEPPRCRLVEREPVWDGYGWRQRRPIRVCDQY